MSEQKSLVVEALKDCEQLALMCRFSSDGTTRHRARKAIRIAEIEHRAVEWLRIIHDRQRTVGHSTFREIGKLLAEHSEATR